MNWKNTARKSIIGEKIIMKSIVPDEDTLKKWEQDGRKWTEYYIKPKKYSVAGKDRVDTVTMKNSKTLPAVIKAKIAKIVQDNPDIEDKDIMKHLSEEEQIMIFDNQVDNFENTEMIKTVILEGLAETNLIDGEETIEEFAESVLEFQDIATEIIESVRDHNNPLEKGKSKKSTKQ